MPDLLDGESTEMQGSGVKPYVLKNTGGVYSCDCPAWRNQSIAIERRTCKHLKKLRGEEAEAIRVGADAAALRVASPRVSSADSDEVTAEGSAPPLLLAHSWTHDVDLTGWWMSEKLDGVRAYWDGARFISRLGNTYHAPDWFLEGLPSTPLDGELWCGRKKFQRCVSIARRQDKSDQWRELTYVVFDAPAMKAPFEQRIGSIAHQLAPAQTPYARYHEHARCESVAHLKEELARVESLGGEGLMLRKPGSHYEVGRSMTLLKVKSFKDAEARVVEHLAGSGRHKGRLGALLVELPDGTRFSVGTGLSDAERKDPPKIGAIVTFRYQELSDGGVPRFPSYVGERHDVAFSSAVPPRVSAAPAPEPKTASRPDPSVVVQSSAVTSGGALRHFEYVDEGSNKFWEISVTDCEHKVRYGRVGSPGQTKLKTFPTPAAALAAADALVREKLAKGYVER
jgi:DNA ligase 1